MTRDEFEKLDRLQHEVVTALKPLVEDASPSKLFLMLHTLVTLMLQKGCPEELITKHVRMALSRVRDVS